MKRSPTVLATDLDGTLIPNTPAAAQALPLLADELSAHTMQLAYVTGRHLASVEQAIRDHDLPLPDWILCDVGTNIYQRLPNNRLQASNDFLRQLAVNSQSIAAAELLERLGPIPDLILQEPEKQGRYKLSFYGDANKLSEIEQSLLQRLASDNLPYSVIASIDPFNNDGLFDLLPLGVSKAFALQWWLENQGLPPDCTLFAGDSGNDSAVFKSGLPSIIVGNASTTLKAEMLQYHAKQGWTERLFVSVEDSTQGVLAGVRHYLAASTDSEP
ncbi:MAG: HAD family hydrolase [Pirellulaceae bacterium]